MSEKNDPPAGGILTHPDGTVDQFTKFTLSFFGRKYSERAIMDLLLCVEQNTGARNAEQLREWFSLALGRKGN